jgi:hypothetical protein
MPACSWRPALVDEQTRPLPCWELFFVGNSSKKFSDFMVPSIFSYASSSSYVPPHQRTRLPLFCLPSRCLPRLQKTERVTLPTRSIIVANNR